MTTDENRLELIGACLAVRLLVLDIDGVLCDGHAWQDSHGRMRRSFSVRDAIALRRWKKAGFKVAVITQVKSDEVRSQISQIEPDFFIDDCDDKVAALSWIRKSERVEAEEIAIFTAENDDVQLLSDAGLAITSPNAPEMVRRAVAVVSRHEAGDGAVAEVCGWIQKMKARAGEFDRAGGSGM